MELERNAAALRQLGLGLAAISYDSVAVLRSFAERKGIHFSLLSDPDSKIIRAFGILNESVPANNAAFYGIPYPGTFIVDHDGKVTAKFFEDDFRQRYSASEILVRQFGASPEASRSQIEARHVRVVSSASTPVLAPGQRIVLILDLDLPPQMHLYAPGVEGYIPIDWKIDPSAAIVAHPATYPQPEKLRLEAIDETVPVYQKHVRLLRDVTIVSEAKAGDLTIHGSLRYQACDDRKCYVPETVPLAWNLQVEPHDLVRAPLELQRKGR